LPPQLPFGVCAWAFAKFHVPVLLTPAELLSTCPPLPPHQESVDFIGIIKECHPMVTVRFRDGTIVLLCVWKNSWHFYGYPMWAFRLVRECSPQNHPKDERANHITRGCFTDRFSTISHDSDISLILLSRLFFRTFPPGDVVAHAEPAQQAHHYYGRPDTAVGAWLVQAFPHGSASSHAQHMVFCAIDRLADLSFSFPSNWRSLLCLCYPCISSTSRCGVSQPSSTTRA